RLLMAIDPLHAAWVAARHVYLRHLCRLSYLDDAGLQTLPMPVRLGRYLLGLREQRLHLAQVEERVLALVLLDDARDDVALAPGELLVRHLPLGVTELLVDDLLGRLRRDA